MPTWQTGTPGDSLTFCVTKSVPNTIWLRLNNWHHILAQYRACIIYKVFNQKNCEAHCYSPIFLKRGLRSTGSTSPPVHNPEHLPLSVCDWDRYLSVQQVPLTWDHRLHFSKHRGAWESRQVWKRRPPTRHTQGPLSSPAEPRTDRASVEASFPKVWK